MSTEEKKTESYMVEAINQKRDGSENVLDLSWTNKPAQDRANQIASLLGKPTSIGKKSGGSATWINVSIDNCEFAEWHIKDESIPHLVPAPHIDFFYVSYKLKCPHERVSELLSLSESVVYDRLKSCVTARCHFMPANIVSIYLCKKIALGEKSADFAKLEYGTLIKELAMEEKNGMGVMGDTESPLGPYHKSLISYLAE